MKKVLYTVLTTVPLIFFSCNSDEDTTAPIIEHVHTDESVAAGDDITLDADFTDNEGLGQAKVDIHDIFDGHDHGRIQISWSETRTLNLEGLDDEIEETFTVPNNATAGPYHAVVQCIDNSGNNAEFKEVDFWVIRVDAPQFTIVNPAEYSDFQVGDIIRLEGSVDDQSGIEEVFVRIYAEEDHDHDGEDHGHLGDKLYESEEEVSGATSFDLGTLPEITLDASWAEDTEIELIIQISAIDLDGHISKTEIEVHLD